ncbi:MAG: hypothetical protein HOW73_03780 [Polyangiaceae bacterium]|nr:hypothetical protein [Polyangiaceae bacterium]
MATPYRDELSALREKLEAVTAELNDTDRIVERRRILERERDDLHRRLHHLTSYGPLEDVRIASPCTASWDAMQGDHRVRFCGSCEKNVYNVAGMTRGEAIALLRETNGNVCLRLYRRADGTVITSDCPVGERKKRVRRLALVTAGIAAGAGSVTAMAGSAFLMMGAPAPHAEVGKMVATPPPSAAPSASAAMPPDAEVVMGAMIPEETARPEVTPPTPSAKKPAPRR